MGREERYCNDNNNDYDDRMITTIELLMEPYMSVECGQMECVGEGIGDRLKGTLRAGKTGEDVAERGRKNSIER